jgi:allantoinase
MARRVVFRSRRVVTERGLAAANVLVEDGRIRRLDSWGPPAPGAELVDSGDCALLPGVVDSHVHVNEPGRTDWEGFETATAAAAAGGVTTIVDMPLNCLPVTTTREAMRIKEDTASPKARVDWGMWGGVIPGNEGELDGMIDAGVCGFKCFLVHSGIDEFPNATEEDLDRAMPILARRGSVLLVHAELPGPIEAAAGGGGDPRRHDTWLRSRPRAAEDEAVALVVRLAEKHGCRAHIVHLSSADALPLLREAKRRGVPITVETCPHYLTFAAEEIPDGQTHFKCAPPIRERENRERLWEGLRDGTIDLVVSDHSPCTPELKRLDAGDYQAAWGGISSLQLGLAAIWTAARERGFGLVDLARWMSRGPARLAGLADKGAIAPGHDADFTLLEPDRVFTPSAGSLRHRHPITPWAGRALAGFVERTFLRGEAIWDHGRLPGAPRGRRVRPERSA